MSARLARPSGIPAFTDAFNLDHVGRGYYSIHTLNPARIVPLGPEFARKRLAAGRPERLQSGAPWK